VLHRNSLDLFSGSALSASKRHRFGVDNRGIGEMEERKQSRYVKLTKDQTPLEDITPGELNQPVQVPQVTLPLLLSINPFIPQICVCNNYGETLCKVSSLILIQLYCK